MGESSRIFSSKVMIAVADIVNNLKSHLDAEGSDYYTFEQDYKYAINRSIDFVTGLFNAAFAEKKLSEENLRELLTVRIYKATQASTLKFSAAASDQIWSVTSIFPKPITSPTKTVAEVAAMNEGLIPDVFFTDSEHDAKRLTQEQWSKGRLNLFSHGNTTLTGSLVTYAFLNFARYGTTTDKEIAIRPSVAGELVGVGILSYPTHITSEADSIQFPQVLTNMITDKALFYIAYKQGDQTNAAAISDKEVKELISLMV